MTEEQMRAFIMEETPFSELEKGAGIYESRRIGEMSIGVSFEDLDDVKDAYVFNLFVNGEYINICGNGSKENLLPNDVLTGLVKTWNSYR